MIVTDRAVQLVESFGPGERQSGDVRAVGHDATREVARRDGAGLDVLQRDIGEPGKVGARRSIRVVLQQRIGTRLHQPQIAQ